MKKETIKTLVIGILVGIIIAGGTGTVIAYSVNSNSVNFRSADSAWKVNTVAEAIDDLYIKKTGDNYSTEERVVGTWIDGKPLYQKVVTNTTSKTGWAVGYTQPDAEFLMVVKCYVGIKDGTNDWLEATYQTPNSRLSYGISGNTVKYEMTSVDNGTPVILIIQYTKTTDQVQSNEQAG